MTHKTIQQATDLWEAWIEFNHEADGSFGTLYVVGEARVAKKAGRPIFLKEMDECMPGHLNLHLQTGGVTNRCRTREVMYVEPIHMPGQYRSIAIFFEGELLAELDEIETVV